MKQLSDAELKEYAVNLLDKQGLEQYEQFIEEHEQKLRQDPETNGFRDVPEECEDSECNECTLIDDARRAFDCPYVDVI